MKETIGVITLIILSVVVMFLLILGIIFAFFGMRVATAGIFGAEQAKIQIQSAPCIRHDIKWFVSDVSLSLNVQPIKVQQ